MRIEAESYELNELAELASVTLRTIRYYVQQGLLNSPGSRGPGARYDASSLHRLKLIRLWQRAHLPLAEIRRRLETMSDADVRVALDRSSGDDVEPRSGSDRSLGEQTGATALSYVRDLLGTADETDTPSAIARFGSRTPLAGGMPSLSRQGTSASMPVATGAPSPPQAPPAAPELPSLALSEAATADVGQKAKPPLRSTWERHTLAPDVELHVRRPLTREVNRLLERLLDHARRLFDEEG